MGFKKKDVKRSSAQIEKEKDLHKLKRIDLLEILVEQARELETLRSRVEDLEQQLADRTITLENTGNIAAAALELNHVMEAAQSAAQQYLDNVARLCAQKEQETVEKCRAMEQETADRCTALEKETLTRCKALEAGKAE